MLSEILFIFNYITSVLALKLKVNESFAANVNMFLPQKINFIICLFSLKLKVNELFPVNVTMFLPQIDHRHNAFLTLFKKGSELELKK